ncbi:hypothetical protein KEJ19_04895 [Candidatus Bathyarchaeota archaeon]|nr:hypothetical protein [Candidatus Bathyarchaeota archaeon]
MPRVFTIFWFDCEDFVTPESDDALKRLAEILKANKIRGVFKLVGEKLRALERRERWDVIEALKFHEIGYHTNYHSVHPTVAEYLKNIDFEEGISEFLRREGKGVEDIERLFGVKPSCYGQPGGAWAPQVYPALRKMGIPVYLDLTNIIALEGGPFWYCGILNILNLAPPKGGVIGLNFELGSPGFIEKAMKRYDGIYDLIRDWGIVSVYNHPCTLVTAEFWDAVNFSRGQNTPISMLKMPRLKPKHLVEEGYKDFEKFVRHVKAKPWVEFVTAQELYRLFKDKASERLYDKEEIAFLASNCRRISFQRLEDAYLSASEIFWLITASLAEYRIHGELPERVKNFYPLGPFRSIESEAFGTVKSKDILDEAYKARIFMESQGRIPDWIEIRNLRISPEDFLASEAELYVRLRKEEHPSSKRVQLVKADFQPFRYISPEGARDSWKWIVFPEGFEAWRLVELAKLQTWTMKPSRLEG